MQRNPVLRVSDLDSYSYRCERRLRPVKHLVPDHEPGLARCQHWQVIW